MGHTAQHILRGVTHCVPQGWQEHGYSVEWAREAGLDIRGLRFARDVRRQLEGITGPQGSHLLGTPPPTTTVCERLLSACGSMLQTTKATSLRLQLQDRLFLH